MRPRFSVLLRVSILIAGIAIASLAFWEPLQLVERSNLRKLTAAHARTVRLDVMEEMQDCMMSQVRLAKLLGENLPGKNSQYLAKMLIKDYDGILAEQWLDSSFRVHWAVTDSGEDSKQDMLRVPDALLKSVLKELKDRGEENGIFTPVSRLWNGKSGRRIVVPVRHQDKLMGFVIASVSREKLFEKMLEDQAGAGYGIAITDGKEEVYRTGGSVLQNDAELVSSAEFPVFGIRLRAQIWPDPELLAGARSRLLEIAIAAGSVIGLLLFAAVDFALASRARSEELRRASDQLELRVQERTRELVSLNKELEVEIRERKQAQVSLEQLSGQLLKTRDEEQRRIARELHDSTTQVLGAIAINLDRARRLFPRNMSKAENLLAQSSDLLDELRQELSTITYLLHPPILDSLGLEGVLPWYASGFTKRSGITVNVKVQPGLGRLPQELEVALFRILQEALTNIHRHSGSSTADITLLRDKDQVTFEVADQGHGVPSEILKPRSDSLPIVGIGIAGMRERVRQLKGRFEIESGERGTSIKVILPMEAVTGPEHDTNQSTDFLQPS